MIWLSVKKLYEVVLSLSATRVIAAASAIKTQSAEGSCA
jgi:hypothetical protein